MDNSTGNSSPVLRSAVTSMRFLRTGPTPVAEMPPGLAYEHLEIGGDNQIA